MKHNTPTTAWANATSKGRQPTTTLTDPITADFIRTEVECLLLEQTGSSNGSFDVVAYAATCIGGNFAFLNTSFSYGNDKWVIDSGAFFHIFENISLFPRAVYNIFHTICYVS